MQTFIALLRGVNVGGKGRLPMVTLVKILESLGCTEVRTYIQSGNAVFKSPKSSPVLTRELQAAIQTQQGFTPQTIMLKKAEWQAAIRANPFVTQAGKDLHLFFLATLPKQPDLAGLHSGKAGLEEFSLRGRVFYLHTPEGIGRSKLAAKVEQCLRVPATARNWNTVKKLMAMAGE